MNSRPGTWHVVQALGTSRRLAILLAVLALAVVAGSAGAGTARGSDRTIRTGGTEAFIPNAKIYSTLRFEPGHIVIKSGETITLTKADKTEAPHTLSIVDAADVPTNVEGVFGCGEPGTVCDEVFQLLGQGPPPAVTEGPGTAAGIDGRLDTLVIFPGDSVSAPVTAPAGSTLHFMCAIHAWMQGTIDVQ